MFTLRVAFQAFNVKKIIKKLDTMSSQEELARINQEGGGSRPVRGTAGQRKRYTPPSGGRTWSTNSSKAANQPTASTSALRKDSESSSNSQRTRKKKDKKKEMTNAAATQHSATPELFNDTHQSKHDDRSNSSSNSQRTRKKKDEKKETTNAQHSATPELLNNTHQSEHDVSGMAPSAVEKFATPVAREDEDDSWQYSRNYYLEGVDPREDPIERRRSNSNSNYSVVQNLISSDEDDDTGNHNGGRSGFASPRGPMSHGVGVEGGGAPPPGYRANVTPNSRRYIGTGSSREKIFTITYSCFY